MEMPLKYIFLGIVALADLGWTIFIFLHNPKDKINIFFALTVLGLGIWSACAALLGWSVSSYDLSIIIRKCAFIAGLFAAMNFFIFTYYYPYRKKFLSSEAILQILLSFTVTVLLVSSDIFIKGAVRSGGEWMHTYNPLPYGIFSLVLLFYLVFGFYNLFTSALSGEKGLPYRSLVIIVGVGAVAVLGVLFSLVMPYINVEYTRFLWIGPASSLFTIMWISYFVFLKRSC